MAYTFGEAQTEFYARGFDYLNQDAAGRTRAKRWLNEAYLEDICADEPWDFLRTSASGTAPLTISDLDTIISVKDTTQDTPLWANDQSWLEQTYADLSTTGDPQWFYITGDTSLNVYPANTSDTIEVQYFKVPAELSDDADTFLVPSRFQGLIIDFAVVRAYWDTDDPDMGDRLEARAQRRLDGMRSAYQVRDPHPRMVVSTESFYR